MQNLELVNWVGHRGWPAKYPENGITGVLAACAAGAVGVEFDVQMSADGVPVVLHDVTLQRTNGSRIDVGGLTVDALQRLNIGEPARFGKRFVGEKLATLADFAEALAAWPDVTVFVELKEEMFARWPLEDCLVRVWRALAPIAQQVVIISFALGPLRSVQKQRWCPVGWVLERYDRESYAQVARDPVEFLAIDYRLLQRADESPWHGPWQWFVYDVVDRAVADWCVQHGIYWQETWDIGLVKDF